MWMRCSLPDGSSRVNGDGLDRSSPERFKEQCQSFGLKDITAAELETKLIPRALSHFY